MKQWLYSILRKEVLSSIFYVIILFYLLFFFDKPYLLIAFILYTNLQIIEDRVIEGKKYALGNSLKIQLIGPSFSFLQA